MLRLRSILFCGKFNSSIWFGDPKYDVAHVISTWRVPTILNDIERCNLWIVGEKSSQIKLGFQQRSNFCVKFGAIKRSNVWNSVFGVNFFHLWVIFQYILNSYFDWLFHCKFRSLNLIHLGAILCHHSIWNHPRHTFSHQIKLEELKWLKVKKLGFNCNSLKIEFNL